MRLLNDDMIANVRGSPGTRRKSGKLYRYAAEKDRQQASFIIATMAEDRPSDIRGAYEAAMPRGPE